MGDSPEQAGKADPKALYAMQKSEERYQRITEAITDYIYVATRQNGSISARQNGSRHECRI